MKKVSSRKSLQRRKDSEKSKATRSKPEPRLYCMHCRRLLEKGEKVLFVEEEIGRVFCSEGCITAYFLPDVEYLEQEYFKNLQPIDLSEQDRESLSHLRWMTLQSPDEVWCEKTQSGDHRYTLISAFNHEKFNQIWCVSISLFLRGEPSFLYLAFVTRDAALVEHFRQGERLPQKPAAEASEKPPVELDGRLAAPWTPDETYLAELNKSRRKDDIPLEEFDKYEGCLEETLEVPDEVWMLPRRSRPGLPLKGPTLYHFMRHYPGGKRGLWYIIIARETDNRDQLEILDAFPTRDPGMVDRFRTGQQEVGKQSYPQTSHLVH